MKKIFVRVKKKAEQKNYYSSWNGLGGAITITDGKISSVSFYQDGKGGGGYSARPGDSVFYDCRYDIFDLMCRHDTEKFKSILKSIKDTDPKNYQYGCSLLESEKEEVIAQAQSEIKKASSKFDL